MIKFLNNNKSNNTPSTSAKLNVFLQEEEPEIKEGIWLQSSDLTYDNIAVDENTVANEEWDTLNSYASMPIAFHTGSAVNVDTDVYLFNQGGVCYKYDVLTNTYEEKTKVPYTFYGQATSVGTDIFLVGVDRTGSSNVNVYCYKYDTLTDTYEKKIEIPVISVYKSSVVSVGTDVYIFGGYYYRQYAEKYDTLTNTYKQIAQLPFSYENSAAVVVDTDIFLIGSDYSDNDSVKCYKYNTISDEYTRMADLPEKVKNGAYAVYYEDNIYILGGSLEQFCIKYNVSSNTYEKLLNIPDILDTFQGDAVCIDGKIYCFGCGSTAKSLYVLNLLVKDYSNNSIVISQGGHNKKTQLLGHANITGRLLQYFYDAWHYTTEGKLNKTIPTYYGDGEKWIKFKN